MDDVRRRSINIRYKIQWIDSEHISPKALSINQTVYDTQDVS